MSKRPGRGTRAQRATVWGFLLLGGTLVAACATVPAAGPPGTAGLTSDSGSYWVAVQGTGPAPHPTDPAPTITRVSSMSEPTMSEASVFDSSISDSSMSDSPISEPTMSDPGSSPALLGTDQAINSLAASVSLSTHPPRTAGMVGTKEKPILAEASGSVLIDAQGMAVLCPPVPVPADGVVSTSTETPTPACPQSIATVGLDPTKLADTEHNSTHRWGFAHVVGKWDGKTLAVTRQDAVRPVEPTIDSAVPCAPPQGGWPTGGVPEEFDQDAIVAAVGPQFGDTAIGYPYGVPATESVMSKMVTVLIVGTAGDTQTAERAIRKVYAGSLCVVHSEHTAAEIQTQQSQLLAEIQNHGISFNSLRNGTAHLGDPGPLTVHVDDLTPALNELLATFPGPPVTVDAFLHPVG